MRGPSKTRKRARNLVHFFTPLSVMVRSGLSLPDALLVMEKYELGIVADLSRFLYEEISKGRRLSDAMKADGRFAEYTIEGIKAAEDSGKLDEILERLAFETEKQERLRKELLFSLTYPAAMLMIGLCIFLVIFLLVRKLGPMLEEMGATLPTYMTWLIEGSNMLLKPIPIMLGLGVLYGLYKLSQNRRFIQRFRNLVHRRAPIFSLVLTYTSNIRFCRLLSLQLEAGCPIHSSVASALRGTEDPFLIEEATSERRKLKRRGKLVSGGLTVVGALMEGQKLSEALAHNPNFDPRRILSMVTVAEEQGRLAAGLMDIAQVLEDELDYRLAVAVSLLEPLFIVCIGILVGGVAIGFFLPLLKLIQL